jgi:hypothetical protein
MHTGSATVPLPSIGAWLSYGLGTFNTNLPPYIVFCEANANVFARASRISALIAYGMRLSFPPLDSRAAAELNGNQV